MSKHPRLTAAQVARILEEREHLKAHQDHVRKVKRMVLWAGIAVVILLTGHDLAFKAVEFIAGSLFDVLIQWE